MPNPLLTERAAASGASLNRHRSNSTVQTPPEFLAAVEAKFGLIGYDLAATPENSAHPTLYYTEAMDSLQQDWVWQHYVLKRAGLDALLWLNPPYSDIAPWVAKAAEAGRRGVHMLVLIPASVGANWWRDHVHMKCMAHLLNGRIRFVGHRQPYPKDLALLEYGAEPGYEVWRWKDSIPLPGEPEEPLECPRL